LNIASTVYELVPFSFVLDWVINVGSVLEGLTAFQGKTCKDGWLCSMITSRTSYTYENFVKGSGVYSLDPVQPFVTDDQVERRFVRKRMLFTPASLRIQLDLNVSRCVDSIALLNQVVRGPDLRDGLKSVSLRRQ